MSDLNLNNSSTSLNYEIHTFGCKVNVYDSGLIEQNLAQNKLNTDKKVHIINSCAVTQEATKDAIKLARKIKSKNPFALVVATGCAAQVDSELLNSSPAIDLVVANSHKSLLPQYIEQLFKGTLSSKVIKSNIFKKEDLELGGGIESHHSRAFLKIQDGCNSFCSFCVIPYARGLSRSLPKKELIKRIKELHNLGLSEVVLTGVHIGDYHDQLENQGVYFLKDLVRDILAETPIKRIRLGSLEPIELSDDLFELFLNDRVCPHFHMSIQSASDSVLKAMKRNYQSSDVIAALNKIAKRLPHAFVGMDVIAGFPTETEDNFYHTYKVLSELEWTRLHVFPYSERKGTVAATFDQLPMSERKARAQKLRELSANRFLLKAKAQVGLIKKAIIVGDAHFPKGISSDYWDIEIANISSNLFSQYHKTEQTIKIINASHELGAFQARLMGEVIRG